MHRVREYAKNCQQTIFIYQFFSNGKLVTGIFFSLGSKYSFDCMWGVILWGCKLSHRGGKSRWEKVLLYYSYNVVLHIGVKNHPPKTSQLHLCGCCNLIICFFGSYLYFSRASDLFPCIHWVLHLWLRQTEKLLIKLGVGWGRVKI